MPFKVKLFAHAPDYEALHVAKITHFPMEKRDYKPYSQVRCCFDGAKALHLQFLSFESTPLPSSLMRADLRLEEARGPLSLVLRADGNSQAFISGGPVQGVLLHTFTGEDLQGVFWGGNLTVPAAILDAFFPGFAPLPGKCFWGNFYKICEDPRRPHYGSYFPADFSLRLDDQKNLGEFLIIDY